MESKKTTAGILAILLGGLGVHKFYLGYTTPGIIQLVLGIVTCGAAGIVGFVEGIIYLTKSDEDFIATYQVGKKEWF
jgi:TM2 domain-containing membrane protein YozV